MVGIGDSQGRTFCTMQESLKECQSCLSMNFEAQVKSYKLFWVFEKRNSESIHLLIQYLRRYYYISKGVIPKMQRQSQMSIFYNNNNIPMEQVEGDNDVLVQPQNAIIFYRNQFQSAATISITRRSNAQIQYSIKTTNKKAYRVSSSEGYFKDNQQKKYIDIMINQNTPLEQCLMDRFKLILIINGKAPKYKKFKVIIDYKKDSKIKEKNLNYLQTSSRASGSIASTAATSVLGHPIAFTKKSSIKQSKLVSYLPKGIQNERSNLKLQLDQLVKQVQQRRLRLQYLQQQNLKKAFRKKIGCYITVFVMFLCFILGIVFRKIANTALKHFEYSL